MNAKIVAPAKAFQRQIHRPVRLMGLLLAVSLLQPTAMLPAQAKPAQSESAQAAKSAPDYSGDWQGEIRLPGQPLSVTIHLKQADGSWSGTIDIPQQKAKDLTLSDFTVADGVISFKIKGVPGEPTFKGSLDAQGASLSGKFSQGGQSFEFGLTRASAAQKAEKADDAKLTAELREMIKQALAVWHTPGVAVAVIRDGKVLLSEGFGQRNLAKNLPVTPDTLFAIGSSTKAFTATALGMLVDEGKLDWDKPVHGVMPDFELQDPFATAEMSARDLLTHRSGLPRHDLSWYDSGRSREELYHSLKYLEPTAPFRTRFQYQNLMFMTAGVLLEKLSGESWEDFIHDRIFKPLGMKRSNTSSSEMQADADHSQPYKLRDDKPVEIPFRPIDAMGPAGSIHSSIRDMTRWLQFNLDAGSVADDKGGSKQLLAVSTMDEIHAPQVVAAHLGSPESPYTLYGMGWFIQPYRGHTLLQHGGNIDGFTAMVSLMPQDRLGVVVLSNKNGDMLPTALMFAIDDKLLKLDPIDWNARLKGSRPPEDNTEQATYPQIAGTHPSHELGEYVGTYSHPAYGDVRIDRSGDRLTMAYRNLGGNLKHWHYDSFRVDDPDHPNEGQLLSFQTNELGDLSALEMSLEASAQPIRFARQIDPRLSLPATLAQYAGHYRIGKNELDIQVEDGRLVMHIAGQPAFQLDPYRENFFKLKNYAGYLARFELKDGKVVAVTLIQPNGVFKADKLTK